MRFREQLKQMPKIHFSPTKLDLKMKPRKILHENETIKQKRYTHARHSTNY